MAMKKDRAVFDYSRLLGKIKEKCNTQDVFAKRMEISRTSLSKRLNNLIDFTSDEMIRACKILDISFTDIPLYFFTLKV